MFSELGKLYPVLANNEGYTLPSVGYEKRRIGAVFVINNLGNLRQVQILGKEDTLSLLVPWDGDATSGIKPRFLWGNLPYCLGLTPEGKNPKRTAECFDQFKQKHFQVQKDINSPAFDSFCQFLKTWDPDNVPEDIPGLEEFIKQGKIYCVFQIQTEIGYLHEDPEIKSWWDEKGLDFWKTKEEAVVGQCSVTGRTGELARIHPSIKGISGGDSSGSSLVNFNKSSFESYGREQSFNAPMLQEVSFKAHAALNCLLSDKKHSQSIGNTSIVYWSKPIEVAGEIPLLESIGVSDGKYQDEATRASVQNFLTALRTGKPVHENADLLKKGEYCIAGLAGYGGRSSIQFFYKDTCDQIHGKLRDHLNCLELYMEIHGEQRNPPTVRDILKLVEEKKYNPSNTTKLFRSILFKEKYPLDIYHRAMYLLSLPRKKEYLPWWVEYNAVSYVKAVLTRNFGKEVSMSLDQNCKNSGYLMGRLFSTLSKAEEESSGNDNMNNLMNAASQSPQRIFGSKLLPLNRHHLKKLNPGRRVNFEKKIQEIMSGVVEIPKTLNTQDKAQFFVGYFHQRQDFFSKKEKLEVEDSE